MVKHVLFKCPYTIIFLMYWSGCSNETPVPGSRKPLSFGAFEWKTNLLRDKGDEMVQRGDSEPGFDLTDEEIKKFKLWPKGVIPYYIDIRSYSGSSRRWDLSRHPNSPFWPWDHWGNPSKLKAVLLNTIINKDNIKQRDFIEPGFDLSDEEIKKFKLWPKGVIPYYIDVRSYSDKVLRDRIRWLLNAVNSLTSLNFMELPSPPKDDATRWVFFINRRGLLGCADHSIKNFTTEGVQQVVLGYDCMSTGGELAEAVLAIAGVPPQHNAPNREDYIKVIDENIQPEKKYLFEILKDDEWLFHDVHYDFSSAGHYHYHKYSENGRATIETQDNYFGAPLGETSGFSQGDIWKMRMLYNYIAKKKEDTLPECNKLFVPGTKFKQYHPYKEEIEPRKKTNKYLGLPEEANDEKEIEDSKNKSETVAESDNEADNVSNKDDEGSEDKVSEVPNGSTDVTKPTGILMLKKHINKRDPLSYLSDYHTGDEIYAKKAAKNVGVQYMKFGKSVKQRRRTLI